MVLLNYLQAVAAVVKEFSIKSFHSVTCHGEGQQLGIGLLKSIVRRFNLPKEFLD